MPQIDPQNVVKSVPEPQVIRARLSQVVREASVLRDLLKIAERIENGRKTMAAAEVQS